MTDAAITTYSVPEITCGHCTSSIEGAVQELDGVEQVSADVDTKIVTVHGGRRDEIVSAIEDVGFDVAP